jgi:hypothetical protein
VHALVIPNGSTRSCSTEPIPSARPRCAARSARDRPTSKSAASIPTRTGCRRSTRWPNCAPAGSTRADRARRQASRTATSSWAARAKSGLGVERLAYEGSDWRELVERLLAAVDAPVVHVRAFLDEATLYALYAAADAVLANSGKEPFGLVGLEVMAAGGIAVCGATGEEYAEPFVNAIVCDTSRRPRACDVSAKRCSSDPDLAAELRTNGAETAARYSWENALDGARARKVAYVDDRVAR